jgi:hypothetical protein
MSLFVGGMFGCKNNTELNEIHLMISAPTNCTYSFSYKDSELVVESRNVTYENNKIDTILQIQKITLNESEIHEIQKLKEKLKTTNLNIEKTTKSDAYSFTLKFNNKTISSGFCCDEIVYDIVKNGYKSIDRRKIACSGLFEMLDEQFDKEK